MIMGVKLFFVRPLTLINDFDLGNQLDTPVPYALTAVWPVVAYSLPMSFRIAWAWQFVCVIFDLGNMTLNLGIVSMLLFFKYWFPCGLSEHAKDK